MSAETTTTSANDIYYSAVIADRILQELRPLNPSRGLFRWEPAGNSKAVDFPTQDDPGAAAAPGEATDITNTSLATSKATVTAAEVGLMTTVTDLLVKVSILDAMSQFSGVLSRSVAEKFETDACALYDDFTGTSNTTTAASTLTPADLLAAVSGLEQRDIPGNFVSVLHPKQVGELRAEVVSTTATHFGGGEGNGLVGPNQDAQVGSLFGVPIYQSSLIVETTGLKGGAVFVRGEAVGAYELWGPRVELQRDASLRATEVVATQCYGVGEISDTRGQTLKSIA